MGYRHEPNAYQTTRWVLSVCRARWLSELRARMSQVSGKETV